MTDPVSCEVTVLIYGSVVVSAAAGDTVWQEFPSWLWTLCYVNRISFQTLKQNFITSINQKQGTPPGPLNTAGTLLSGNNSRLPDGSEELRGILQNSQYMRKFKHLDL